MVRPANAGGYQMHGHCRRVVVDRRYRAVLPERSLVQFSQRTVFSASTPRPPSCGESRQILQRWLTHHSRLGAP